MKCKTYRIPGIDEPVKVVGIVSGEKVKEMIRQGKAEKVGPGLYRAEKDFDKPKAKNE